MRQNGDSKQNSSSVWTPYKDISAIVCRCVKMPDRRKNVIYYKRQEGNRQKYLNFNEEWVCRQALPYV